MVFSDRDILPGLIFLVSSKGIKPKYRYSQFKFSKCLLLTLSGSGNNQTLLVMSSIIFIKEVVR